VTATLPSAASAGNGATVRFTTATATTTNNLTIAAAGGDTVNGGSTLVLSVAQYSVRSFMSDGGTAWMSI